MQFNERIGDWSAADLRRFVVNLMLSDPGALPKEVSGPTQRLPSPASDGNVPVWDTATNSWVTSGTHKVNYSQLTLANSIVSGDIVDGTIVDADVNASAALAPSKFAGYPTDIQKILTGAGTWKGGLSTIFDSTLGADAASIDTGANGIPATFAHLLCFYYGRSTRVASFEDTVMQFNGLGGATDYRWEQLGVSAAAAAATESVGTTTALIGEVAAASAAANVFSAGLVIIPFYRSANFKNYMALGGPAGHSAAGFNAFRVVSGACATVGVINQIKWFGSVGPNLRAGSRLTIYGLGV